MSNTPDKIRDYFFSQTGFVPREQFVTNRQWIVQFRLELSQFRYISRKYFNLCEERLMTFPLGRREVKQRVPAL
jgi:hypothetical protein